MVRNSAWGKNNRRELKKTLGRFLAMVCIIALGVGFFVGLRSARPTMVNTCTDYLDQTRFYDLQLISSIGFDTDAASAFSAADGIASAEGSISADLMTVSAERSDVFKTHMLLKNTNQVVLTDGRMPRRADEVLADDLAFTAEQLNTTLTVEHQEDSVFSQDTYTIVGLCHSPQYLNLSRGTTSLGNGTITGFLYLTPDGYDTDYYTEVYLRVNHDRNYFDKSYEEYLESLEDPMMDLLEETSNARLDRILTEAREELDDGWQEYYDGLEEYNTNKAEVEQELADAAAELADAQQKLEDGRKELADGEDTLYRLRNDPFSIQELADARAKLDDGWKELADGEAEYQENLEKFHSEEASAQKQISDGRKELSDARKELSQATQQYNAGVAQFQEAKNNAAAQKEAMRAPVAQAEQNLQKAKASLSNAKEHLSNLQYGEDSEEEIFLAEAAVEAAQEEVDACQDAYDAAKSSYEKNTAMIDEQLDATEAELQKAKAAIDAGQATIDAADDRLDDAEQQLEDARKQLADAKTQLEDARIELEDGEAELTQEIQDAIVEAEVKLADGRAELAEGQQEYEDGVKEYEDGVIEANQEFADAEKDLQDALRDLKEAELDLKRMEEPSNYVLTPSSNAGYVSFDNDSSIVANIGKVFPLFFFLVAALVCSSTMTRMVEEQRTQNGTLKAMGYSDKKIMMRYASYAGSAAIVGFLIGLVIGTYLFPFVIWEAYKMLYHFGELNYVFSWGTVLIALAASMLSSVGAACLAAWNDLQQMPAQLMRPKTPKAGKRIFLEYITPLWNSLGFLAKVSLRNIFRYKKRLFMMVLGTGGCLALLLAGLGLKDSISNVANDQFNQITMYDFVISFDQFLTEDDQQEFREEYSDDLSQCVFLSSSSVDVTTGRGIKSVNVISCSDPAIDTMLGLYWEGTDLGFPTGDGVYISHSLAEDCNLQIGDRMSIRLESNDRIELPITGIFTNYVGNYLYLTEEGYKTWFGIEPEIKAAYASATTDDHYGIGAKLQSRDDVIQVTVSDEMKDTVDTIMTSLNAIMLLVVGCAVALAFVVGYNLININITERVREIATIKVLGFYRNEAHAYVFRESILLTILGVFVGIPLGIWLHRFIMNSVKVDFVCFQIQIAPISFVIGIAITLLVTVIVDRLLGKKIDRINMAESLKSVE